MGTINLDSAQSTFLSLTSSVGDIINKNALLIKMIGLLIILGLIILPIAKYIGYIILGVNIITGAVYCVNEASALEILNKISDFASSFLSVVDNVMAAIIKVTTQTDSNAVCQAIGSVLNFWYNLAASLELKWRIILYIIYAYMFTIIANELILILICIDSILIVVQLANSAIVPNLFSDQNIKQFQTTVDSIVSQASSAITTASTTSASTSNASATTKTTNNNNNNNNSGNSNNLTNNNNNPANSNSLANSNNNNSLA